MLDEQLAVPLMCPLTVVQICRYFVNGTCIFNMVVMRLTKPQLMTTVPVMGEPWDMLGTALEKEQLKDIRTINGLPELSTGEMLGLPQSFG